MMQISFVAYCQPVPRRRLDDNLKYKNQVKNGSLPGIESKSTHVYITGQQVWSRLGLWDTHHFNFDLENATPWQGKPFPIFRRNP